MKRMYNIVAVIAVLVGLLVSTILVGQEKENEVCIRIRKKLDGKNIERIDTLRFAHHDSIKALWYSFNHEKMDSIQKEIKRKMEDFREKHHHDIQKHMEEVRRHMKHIRPEMKKLRDSLHKHRIEVLIPKLDHLDSLKHLDMDIHLRHLDSLGKKMIIRLDSLDQFDFDIDVEMDFDPDSLMEKEHLSVEMPDSIDVTIALHELDIREHIRRGMRHMPKFIFEKEFENDFENETQLKYKNGKVLIIKTDLQGEVTKIIIMNADGQMVDVKEGEEAREFMLEEGEEISLARLKEE
jgi:hypothetical protein